tara:strand:+ start:4499 stop:4744 length:246 start_codon:yes stop_codon:yes gene_type:complete
MKTNMLKLTHSQQAIEEMYAENKKLKEDNEKLRGCVEDCLYSTAMRDPQIYSHKQACDYIQEKTSLMLKELNDSHSTMEKK